MDICNENGKNLLDDAKLLFGMDRFSTAFALAVLAQEEFAKGFLLQLVIDDALPWTPEIRRSMTRHKCKHLAAIIMEWIPSFDFDQLLEQRKTSQERHLQKMAWLERFLDRYRQGNLAPDPGDPEPSNEEGALPVDVATAINIYRYEEVERLRSGHAFQDAELAFGKARKVADGLVDRKKQSALYVDVTKTGKIGFHPGLITSQEAVDAISAAERMVEGPATYTDQYRQLKETLKLVFSNIHSGGVGP